MRRLVAVVSIVVVTAGAIVWVVLRRDGGVSRGQILRMLTDRVARLQPPPALRVDPAALIRELDKDGAGGPLRASFASAAAFDDLFARYQRERVRLDPDWGVHMGVADSPELTRYDPASMRARVHLAALALDRLRALPEDDSRWLERRAFDRELESVLAYHLVFGAELRNPAAATWGLIAGSYHRGRTTRDAEILTARLERAPAMIAEVRRHLSRPPRRWIDSALIDIDGVRQTLAAWRSDATAGTVQRTDDAFSEYAAHLRTLQPSAGAAVESKWAPWARYALMELQFSERGVAQTGALLIEIAHEAAREGERIMSRHPPREPPGRSFEDALRAYREAVPRARAFALEHVGEPPPEGERVIVEATPPYLRTWMTFAGYESAPLSKSREGRFYVTPWDGLQASYDAEIMMTALHETYPGHHLHDVIAKGGDSDALRQYPSAWMSEGWAMYGERLAVEHGFVSDPDYVAQWYGFRSAMGWRSVCDLLLACGDMTEEEAEQYYVVCEGMRPDEARAEVSRMTREPLYLLSYAMGERAIVEARERIEKLTGRRFRASEFHARLLRCGRIPPALAAEAVARRWPR